MSSVKNHGLIETALSRCVVNNSYYQKFLLLKND